MMEMESRIPVTAFASSAELDILRMTCARQGWQLDVAVPARCASALTGGHDAVLFVGKDQLPALPLSESIGDSCFGLLIAHDAAVLECSDLLARCAGVLMAPYEDSHIDACLCALRRSPPHEMPAFHSLEMNIVGESSQLKRMMRQVAMFSGYDTPVMLRGETGTGKELVARGIHYGGSRCDHSFVPVNCCAFNDDLLLSELFGYEKGAFTDAKHSHPGLVTQAAGGTLFLDEVDSLSLKGQGALLRFLQDQEYRPLGGKDVLRSDVRVISATNKNVEQLVRQGRFREDLYYRMHVLHVEVPPLRERSGDVAILAEHFLREFSKRYGGEERQLHPLTLRWMERYPWPGNVRELENYLHRLYVLSQGPTIFVPTEKGDPVNMLSKVRQDSEVRTGVPSSLGYREARERLLWDFERNYLREILAATGGNVSEAARRAGKERRTFGRLLKKHGIERESYLKI